VRTRKKRKRPDPSIGARIADLRSARHVERDDLAKQLRFHPLKMWRLEAGKTHLTADTLRKIAAALDVAIEELFEAAKVRP